MIETPEQYNAALRLLDSLAAEFREAARPEPSHEQALELEATTKKMIELINQCVIWQSEGKPE